MYADYLSNMPLLRCHICCSGEDINGTGGEEMEIAQANLEVS